MRLAWCVAAMLSVCAYAQETGRVEGRVVSMTGEPVRKAEVRLQAVVHGIPAGYIESTSADGSFVFTGIAPGVYSTSMEKSGFAPARVQQTLTIRAGETKRGLVVRMTPLAVIAGRVVDSAGDPVPEVKVTALSYTWNATERLLKRGRETTTDDRGVFRIAELPAGRYYLLAENAWMVVAPPDEEPVHTFYPDRTEVRAAMAIDVRPGQEAAGKDIRIRTAPVYRVWGHAMGPNGEPLLGSLSLDRRDTRDGIANSPRTLGEPFEFFAPPGEYTLRFGAIHPGAGKQGLSVARDITVAGDQEIDLRASPRLIVQGRIVSADGFEFPELVRIADTTPAAVANGVTLLVKGRPLNVALLVAGPESLDFLTTPSVKLGQDGSFRFEEIKPGKYRLSLPSFPGFYLQAVRAGGRDLRGAPLDLTQGDPGPLEIVMARGAGLLAVSRLADSSRPELPRGSVLWPKAPEDLLQSSGVLAVLPGGRNSAPPGDYYLATFEDTDVATMLSYGFLQLFNRLARPVSIQSGQVTIAETPVISRAAVEEALANLP